MNYSLGNTLSRGGALNPDGLSLDLQFATDKTLTARKGPTPVFTRASTATFVGSNGLIQSAAINQARFDHDPVTLASKGLLIEESRTNLCLQSNAFSTSPWGNINTVCAITQNETGVDGVVNSAWTFTDDSVINSEGRYITATLTSGVAYSYSIFVKKTTGTPTTYPAIWLARSGTFGGCVINTTAGTATPITVFGAGTIISTTASVADFGIFWRVTSFVTPTATGSWEISISPSGNGTGTGVMDGTSTGSAVFWGAQLEAGAFPTSYIPTTTASVVRSADICSITGSDFTSFYNNAAGTFVSESMIANLTGNNRGIAQIDSGTTVDIIRHNYALSDGGFTSNIRANTDTPTVFAVVAGAASVIQKRAIAYEGTSFASATNGGAVATVTRTFPVGLNTMRIGSLTSGGFVLTGHIAAIKFYKKRLPNAKLQTLTT